MKTNNYLTIFMIVSLVGMWVMMGLARYVLQQETKLIGQMKANAYEVNSPDYEYNQSLLHSKFNDSLNTWHTLIGAYIVFIGFLVLTLILKILDFRKRETNNGSA